MTGVNGVGRSDSSDSKRRTNARNNGFEEARESDGIVRDSRMSSVVGVIPSDGNFEQPPPPIWVPYECLRKHTRLRSAGRPSPPMGGRTVNVDGRTTDAPELRTGPTGTTNSM